MELGGAVWLVSSGGASGYQYRLQNSDLGLIVFLKSRYGQIDQDHSHLKIECSPHWLLERKADQAQKQLDELAAVFLEGLQSKGCAVHVCVDVQGWQPPENLDDCLITRAKRVRKHQAGNILYMDIGEVCVKHNQGQSYLWGSAASVQMAIYRKDVQAKAIDKLDFWRRQWGFKAGESFDIPLYDDKLPVWRLELRFHHSVLSEFANGEYENCIRQTPTGAYYVDGDDPRRLFASFGGVSKRLTALFRYGLDIFRLEVSKYGAGRFLDPFWQLLYQDVEFYDPSIALSLKRVRKTPGAGNLRNIASAMGNMLSIFARNRVTAPQAWEFLKQSGIYDDIYKSYFDRAFAQARPFDEGEIYQAIVKGLMVRTLKGKAA